MDFIQDWRVPNLRIQETDKYEKDKEWFKKCMNYIKPYGNMGTVQIKDFTTKLGNYRLLNSDIRWEDVQEYCNPLGLTEEFFTDSILPFNIIPKVVNELLGEELKRTDDYRPVLASQNALVSKNQEYVDLVDSYIDNEINKVMQIEQYKIQMQQQGKNPEEAKQEIERKQQEYEMKYKIDENILDFQSQREILASNIIDYGSYDNNIKSIKSQCWKDVLTVDEEIVWVGVEKNKPKVKHVNPLFFIYHKSAEEPYIHKGDWAGTTIPMTHADILAHYGDLLSDDDLENLQLKHTSKEQMFPNQVTYNHHSTNPNVDDESKWGTNLLGKVLMKVREHLNTL